MSNRSRPSFGAPTGWRSPFCLEPRDEAVAI